MAQFVDIETAREFMKETFTKVSIEELDAICQDLEKKSALFQELLSEDAIHSLTEAQLSTLLSTIFSVRRKAPKLVVKIGFDNIKSWIITLLYGSDALPDRFTHFCDQLTDLDVNLRCDLASEMLHYSHPQKYWLWNRWIWDPKPKTGALPLVITDDYSLEAESLGETYLKVGKALAFVRHVGEAAEFEVISKGEFGVDAYLCSVYIVYVYTVLRMRMTQEFNKVMPGLAEFSRRLLGIYKAVPQ